MNTTVTLDTAADKVTTYIHGTVVSTGTSDVTAGELLTAAATSWGALWVAIASDYIRHPSNAMCGVSPNALTSPTGFDLTYSDVTSGGSMRAK